MNHQQIHTDQIMDRYILKQLNANQEEDFEVHLITCAECQEQLPITEQFIDGMATLEFSDFDLSPPANHWRSLAIAASLAVRGI